jgi:EmrB/QacA subfamily drug resistance transporter
MSSPAAPRLGATFAITAGALFMFALDRLIVVTALPAIQRDLGASLQALEWTVSAYTLTFTVLLLAGAALGDRFGRRRMFTVGLALFTAGSAAAALAPTAGALVLARALQGVGGSLIAPLSLTILSAAAPAARRGAVLGAWGAVAAGAAATGPVAGGALADALSWHWIFWVNVPVGLALIPLARRWLDESHGPHSELDLTGIALSGAALLMIVWGLVEAGRSSWSSPLVISTLLAGGVGLAAFVAWERRAPAPMLPMRFFRSRGFAAGSGAALLGYLGMLGALFEIGQLMQTGLGASPLGAGLRLLPMTVAMMVTAPVAGALSDRLGPRGLLAGALALEALALAWLGHVATPGVAYVWVATALVPIGFGAACVFAPVQAVLLGAVRPAEQGQAAGAATAVRELGGVLGVAVLAGVFAAHGGGESPAAFLAGFGAALRVGAVAVAAAAVVALAVPRRRPRRAPVVRGLEPAPQPA